MKRSMEDYLCSLTEVELDNLVERLEVALEAPRKAKESVMALAPKPVAKTTPAPKAAPAAVAKAAPKPAVAAAKVATAAPARSAAPAPAKPQIAPGGQDLAKQLKAMKDRWNKSKEASKKDSGGGTTLPASPQGIRYICQLSGAKIVQSDKGISMLLEWTCVQGDETGEKAVMWLNFTSDEQFVWAQRTLRKFEGLDVDALDPEMLPELCKDLIEAAPAARLSVKENGEYTNVYIDKIVDLEGGEAEAVIKEPPAEEAAEGVAEAVAAEGSEGEEAPAEAVAEEPAAEEAGEGEGEEVETLQPGDDVTYTIKGKPQTGMVKQLLDDDTVDIKNDATKKVDNVDLLKVKKLAEVSE